MILWSIQTPDVWEHMTREGVLRCRRMNDVMSSGGANPWMVKQMHRRLGPPPEPGLFLIWAWHQYGDSNQRKPDLRREGHLEKGEHGVRIEFTAPDAKALLSDFDLWHFVLSYGYLPASEADGERFEAELMEKGFLVPDRTALPDSGLQAQVEQSWERIFDLDWENELVPGPRSEKATQATLWELPLSAVVKVQEFTSR
jgi:hypothetical protein